MFEIKVYLPKAFLINLTISNIFLCINEVVNGGWGDWSDWSACSVSCGPGASIRSRKCDNPPPGPGGQPCQGPPLSNKPCNEGLCPGMCGHCILTNLIILQETFKGGSILKRSYYRSTMKTRFHIYKIIPHKGPLMTGKIKKKKQTDVVV